MRPKTDLNEHPIIVFWEVTRACPLACRHCRAKAIGRPSADELSTEQARGVIDQVAEFGPPRPVLVLTGGDCLRRPDIFDLVGYATSQGIPVALAPSVTPALATEALPQIKASGARSVALSLDGARSETHDRIRGVPGHFATTTAAIDTLTSAGLSIMVNTTVMRSNVDELADIAALVAASKAVSWEVIFLVHVGRGVSVEAISPDEHEQVCHVLFEASQHQLAVRAAEAPFFRRVSAQRSAGGPTPTGDLYPALSERLADLLGPVTSAVNPPSAGTRDGKGVLFVAHNGEIYPAGFLPLSLGNVRSESLAKVYRTHPLLRDIRAARFVGHCGRCGFADLCGGSRSRAFAATGDPLASDPACVHRP